MWIDFGGGKKHYMRSAWERNIARYFEFLKQNGDILEWEYEPQKFIFHKINYGNRTYLPDFRITENDGSQHYVEVKGRMDSSSRTKLRRMLKYYPKVKIEIIDIKKYSHISKLSPVISGWE